MKALMWRASAAALALTLALTLALGAALAHCGARYGRLADAVAREGGADAVCCALVYGGELSDAELKRARERLGAGITLERGARGVYGFFAANAPLTGAVCELRLRGVLGLGARVDRWVCARGATGLNAGRELHVRPRALAPAGVVRQLMAAMGEPEAALYLGARSASARGEKYHAAARAGTNIEYMLAEGYLPVDY